MNFTSVTVQVVCIHPSTFFPGQIMVLQYFSINIIKLKSLKVDEQVLQCLTGILEELQRWSWKQPPNVFWLSVWHPRSRRKNARFISMSATSRPWQMYFPSRQDETSTWFNALMLKAITFRTQHPNKLIYACRRIKTLFPCQTFWHFCQSQDVLLCINQVVSLHGHIFPPPQGALGKTPAVKFLWNK